MDLIVDCRYISLNGGKSENIFKLLQPDSTVQVFFVHKTLFLMSGRSMGTAELLLDSGARLNARTEWGDTPVHYAALGGSLNMFRWVSKMWGDRTVNYYALMGSLEMYKFRGSHLPIEKVGNVQADIKNVG